MHFYDTRPPIPLARERETGFSNFSVPLASRRNVVNTIGVFSGPLVVAFETGQVCGNRFFLRCYKVVISLNDHGRLDVNYMFIERDRA